MPPMIKATLDVKEMYRRCVKATGVLGSTVQNVDDAYTTKFLLKGQSPAMFHPALHTKRLKQNIIREEKLTSSPAGLGIAGVWAHHLKDLALPIGEHYIHSIITTPGGGVIIVTMVPKLANLIHVARTVQVDTTFKRTVGDLNEWEFVIWYGSVERVLTVGRIYTDQCDRPHYKALYDELQKVVFTLTGKNLRFKRFTPGGNLLTIGVDMESAQVQGASDSFLPTNVPSYSGIVTTDADEFSEFYVRACISHCKRGIHALKPYVTPKDFTRLLDFPYMKTQEDVNKFTEWIKTLKVKQVQDWWTHKLQHRWIIPSLIKSRSRILPEDWDITDSTTNLNEGQHHWTNQKTGTKLSLVEAIESARQVDFQTALEVQDSLDTGILENNSNNLHHRLARNVKCRSKAVEKSRAANEATATAVELQCQVDEAKAAHKQSSERLKGLQGELSAAKGASKRTRIKHGNPASENPPLLEANSSGRVITPRRARANAREAASPYPTPSIVLADKTHQTNNSEVSIQVADAHPPIDVGLLPGHVASIPQAAFGVFEPFIPPEMDVDFDNCDWGLFSQQAVGCDPAGAALEGLNYFGPSAALGDRDLLLDDILRLRTNDYSAYSISSVKQHTCLWHLWRLGQDAKDA
ncbi:hypothetical protein B0H10DRAFT_2208657 [Mycena sp. CBHHK59/15]|nr:hypothetical protein B0H10DRAFT_2208657 [Mycena sp. CBHHK59/15]